MRVLRAWHKHGGTWIFENESASFYASICSDLKNRGVTDIFIACHDNPTGPCDAINAIFPRAKKSALYDRFAA